MDHRDLHLLTHSFPTRRSSDLGRGADGAGPGVPPRRNLYGGDPVRRRALLALPPALLLLTAADEPILVPDVSQRAVEIQYRFTGADLLLFGPLVYPDGRRPSKQPAILALLHGPPKATHGK